jgi:hypothetical protein
MEDEAFGQQALDGGPVPGGEGLVHLASDPGVVGGGDRVSLWGSESG